MDAYDLSFFFSTMWVGPFWFAMLVFPEHEMTKKVAGDIFVTRWMWKRCMEQGSERWVAAPTVFFGVMLMPVGIALHAILVRDNSKNKPSADDLPKTAEVA